MTGRREKRVTGDLPGESYDRLYSRPRSRLGISHVNTCLVMIEEREWFTRLVLRDRVAPYRTDYNFVKWFVASAWKNRGWLERKRIDNGNPWAWEFRLPGARAPYKIRRTWYAYRLTALGRQEKAAAHAAAAEALLQ